MGVIFGKSIQENQKILQSERIANEKIETLKKENQELRGLLQKEKTKNAKIQIFAIWASVYFILSLFSFLGIWLSWPVVKGNVSLLENVTTGCSCDGVTGSFSRSKERKNVAYPSSAPFSPLSIKPPAISEPIVSKPIVSELTFSEPTVSEPTVSKPTVSKPTVSEPPINEWDSEVDPWHMICHLYWVVLFQNSEHPSYKNHSSVFESAAARLLQNQKKDKKLEGLRFGRRDCAKFPSKCESTKDSYVRIYHDGHYLDYDFADVATVTNLSGAETGSSGVGSADAEAEAVSGIDLLVAWIGEVLTTGGVLINGTDCVRALELLPDGQHYCVNELSKNIRILDHSWVVHFYNTSNPNHSNLSVSLLSAAHDLVETRNLFFGQLDCSQNPDVRICKSERGVRVAPYIRFYNEGDGGEYFPGDGSADLVAWIKARLDHLREDARRRGMTIRRQRYDF